MPAYLFFFITLYITLSVLKQRTQFGVHLQGTLFKTSANNFELFSWGKLHIFLFVSQYVQLFQITFTWPPVQGSNDAR
jgi:hypothetical protein